MTVKSKRRICWRIASAAFLVMMVFLAFQSFLGVAVCSLVMYAAMYKGNFLKGD